MTEKYSKYLKRTKARTVHQCDCCGEVITNEYYYRETVNDKFLQSLHARSFCVKCYEKFGNKLLTSKGKGKHIKNIKDRGLNDFT